MTTTKESPDSGAGAVTYADLSDCALETPELHAAYQSFVASVPSPAMLARLDYMQFGFNCYLAATIAAQDSGQGEAVAWWNGLRDLPSISWVENTDHDIPLIAGVNPCNTHPPKPAQDAAGKGVEKSGLRISGGAAWRAKKGTELWERVPHDSPHEPDIYDYGFHVGDLPVKPAQDGGV